MLPLVSDAHLFPKPDYSASPVNTFADICRVMIARGFMTLLYLSRYCGRSSEWQETSLSWATNWSGLQAELPPWITAVHETEQHSAAPCTIIQKDSTSLQLECLGSMTIKMIAEDLDTSHIDLTGLELELDFMPKKTPRRRGKEKRRPNESPLRYLWQRLLLNLPTCAQR